jgi:hypothetical protein
MLVVLMLRLLALSLGALALLATVNSVVVPIERGRRWSLIAFALAGADAAAVAAARQLGTGSLLTTIAALAAVVAVVGVAGRWVLSGLRDV